MKKFKYIHKNPFNKTFLIWYFLVAADKKVSDKLLCCFL